ncbi:hypothetical protein [Jeotgalibacillus haloalkalitolerans]|uniref:DUF3888 domain-containing protein n=1 Tax=Jeotgalibacillus haloalkalitolerans TaxID=3104292 RepID=A0ABU5KN34_9BACL|nr:hypothetical protein [Jeotgalibacillus sp. HH7-29]MDZ5712662.1 hypothetical protein [Jeotgalibacillus sp. HH7-29]
MKVKRISSLLMIALISFSPLMQKSEVELIPQNKYPTVMELAFLRELGPSILEAMYAQGDRQLFTSERIEKIVRNKQDDQYDVTIRVIGYEGPFNPHYQLIRLTLRIPGDDAKEFSVVSYERKYITADEVKKLSEFTK